MITFWPPTTIVPADQTSAGLVTVIRSICPVMSAV